jgi:hypothetical protein
MNYIRKGIIGRRRRIIGGDYPESLCVKGYLPIILANCVAIRTTGGAINILLIINKAVMV